MILSILFLAILILVPTLGVRRTRCLEEDEKEKVAIAGEVLFITIGTVGFFISVTAVV